MNRFAKIFISKKDPSFAGTADFYYNPEENTLFYRDPDTNDWISISGNEDSLTQSEVTTIVNNILTNYATSVYVDTEISDAINTHNLDTTNVHGIVDTSVLATQTYADTVASTAVSNHSSDTTDIHGITNTADLATKTYADTAASSIQTNIVSGAPNDLNTLDKIASAIADDPNFATTIQNTYVSNTSLQGMVISPFLLMGC